MGFDVDVYLLMMLGLREDYGFGGETGRNISWDGFRLLFLELEKNVWAKFEAFISTEKKIYVKKKKYSS